MGFGMEATRTVVPEHVAAIENMKEQLLITLVKRLGGDVTLSVDEIDDTGHDVLMMAIDQASRSFRFVVRKKQ